MSYISLNKMLLFASISIIFAMASMTSGSLLFLAWMVYRLGSNRAYIVIIIIIIMFVYCMMITMMTVSVGDKRKFHCGQLYIGRLRWKEPMVLFILITHRDCHHPRPSTIPGQLDHLLATTDYHMQFTKSRRARVDLTLGHTQSRTSRLTAHDDDDITMATKHSEKIDWLIYVRVSTVTAIYFPCIRFIHDVLHFSIYLHFTFLHFFRRSVTD